MKRLKLPHRAYYGEEDLPAGVLPLAQRDAGVCALRRRYQVSCGGSAFTPTSERRVFSWGRPEGRLTGQEVEGLFSFRRSCVGTSLQRSHGDRGNEADSASLRRLADQR